MVYVWITDFRKIVNISLEQKKMPLAIIGRKERIGSVDLVLMKLGGTKLELEDKKREGKRKNTPKHTNGNKAT